VKSLLGHVPEEIVDRTYLIDLENEERSPGINLLDARIFPDRDRTTDSVVRISKGLWEQWGPRMQSILEHTVKTPHEASAHPNTDAGEQKVSEYRRMLAERQNGSDPQQPAEAGTHSQAQG
jgi:hypothetical protein